MLDLSAATLDIYPLSHRYRPVNGKNRIELLAPALAALMIDLTLYADVVWIEEQWSRPMQDAGATFGFGRTFGGIEAAVTTGLVANGCPVEKVAERVIFVPGGEWKHGMRLSADKAKARELASRLFPECRQAWKLISKHTSAAEAALLAFYGASHQGLRVSPGQPILPRPEPYSRRAPSLLCPS